MSDSTTSAPPLPLPLAALHRSRGAVFAPYAGYEMPLQYATGVRQEHLHTRAAAGLFDVSHMGQVCVRARDGRFDTAAHALEGMVPADVRGLADGRQRYAVFTTDEGGISDDLMIARAGDALWLVVNASRKHEDLMHLRGSLSSCTVELHEDVLLAVQGPQAAAALAALAPDSAAMRFMDFRTLSIAGVTCRVTRSGYTGEDGFEIGVPVRQSLDVANALLAQPGVALAGLGARDSLRLEAGLCLYGNDIDSSTSPVEAGLEWSIPSVRRAGGARAGGYPGAVRVDAELSGAARRRRVGLRSADRPVRAGAPLYREASGGESIGAVTSGGFGPSLPGPVAMGYVPVESSALGTLLYADLRGHRYAVQISALPFIPHHYHR